MNKMRCIVIFSKPQKPRTGAGLEKAVRDQLFGIIASPRSRDI